MTPPLLPQEPEPEPFVPSSPAAGLELLSEPETPPVKEHVEIERRVLEGDSIQMDDDGIVGDDGGDTSQGHILLEYAEFGDGDSPQHQAGAEALSTQKRLLGDDLKVEGPITPPISAKKRRSEEVQKSRKDILANSAPELLLQPDDVDDGNDEILDPHLAEIARAAMERVEERLNNERLRHVDPRIRVEVPPLAPVNTFPPWKATGSLPGLACMDTTQLDFVMAMRDDHLRDTVCSLDAKAERTLEWIPFSLQSSRIDVDENIEGDKNLGFLEAPGIEDCVGANSLLKRLEGLQTLRGGDDTDEEELLPEDIIVEISSGSTTSDDMPAATFQRKRVVVEDALSQAARKEPKMKPNKAKGVDICVMSGQDIKRPPPTEPGQGLFQSVFSTTNSLSNFMEIRGQAAKRRKLESSPYFVTSKPEEISQEPTRQQPRLEDKTPLATFKAIESIPAQLLPFPNIPSSSRSLTLVLPTALLKSHRSTVQHLESLGPQHTLIFRDYTQFSPVLQQHQHKKTQPTIHTSPTSRVAAREDTEMDQEADIIISPSTAILFTTSQATTQLYLPGHKPPNGRGPSFDSPLRERIARTCVRYEQLYVLVCHSSRPSDYAAVAVRGKEDTQAPTQKTKEEMISMTIDTRTADSIRSLISFCASLSLHASVTPLIVPSQPSELVKWVKGLAYKHAFQSPSIPKSIRILENGHAGHDVHERTRYNGDNEAILETEDTEEAPSFPEEETSAELFLRRAGLNPFAAQFILMSLAGGTENGSSGLATLMRMDPLERRRKFTMVVGERVFARLERRLEMGWGFV